MGKLRRGRSERNTVGYLTVGKIEDWANKYLNDRDLEILKLLDRFRYMTSEQIYNLVKPVDGYKAFNELATGRTRLNKRLRILFDNFFINKESPQLPYGEGTSPQYCWLDKGGNYLVSGCIDKKVRKDLPQNYLHYGAIVDVFIYFNKINKINPGTVRYFRNEPKQKSIELIPDCVVMINDKGIPRPYIIEVDRCYKKEKEEINKIKKYANWKLSSTWKREQWASLVKGCVFPKIVYLVDDTRKYWNSRVTRMEKEIKNFNIDIEFIPLNKIYEDCNIFIK